ALAVLTKTEFFFLFFGGVYLAEAVSVVLQVTSFKLFGRRIFKMSPLHHHFEMLGWAENKVVFSFWLAAAICIIVGTVLIII
ncbi:MAG: phospho-N-acetylmuramoyl-pentapeptide-transferase, partial [Clostridiales bacterium]